MCEEMEMLGHLKCASAEEWQKNGNTWKREEHKTTGCAKDWKCLDTLSVQVHKSYTSWFTTQSQSLATNCAQFLETPGNAPFCSYMYLYEDTRNTQ